MWSQLKFSGSFNDLNSNRKKMATFPILCLNSISKMNLFLFHFFTSLPGCGHCKAMKPAYTEAAQTMKEQQVQLVKGWFYHEDVSKVEFWLW